MSSTVLNQNNVHAPATPPEYWVWENASRQLVSSQNSSAAGGAVSVGLHSWQALFDCTGLPDGQPLFTIALEYQRPQWTDNAGVVHPANEWLPDSRAILDTGPSPKGSKVISWGSSIGAIAEGGGMVEPYPSHYRFHITSCPGLTVPNIQLILS